MTFYVENETDYSFSFDVDKLIKDVTTRTLEYENTLYKDVTLNVSFTDDESIREVNRQFRDIDKSTDVLSFPAIDYENPSDMSFISEEDADYFEPDTNELILGDIMISIDHVLKQAEEYNHSVLRETAFLLTHSLLHLLGYDHMVDDERLIMEKKQEEILVSLSITRENG